MIAPSQGIHLVFDSSFLQGESAVMVPHTSDGRVLFAIPWHGHTLVGTTDTPIAAATLEPVAMEQEIDFILATAGQYLTKAPTRDDVLSVFAGIRPLVRATDVATACQHGGTVTRSRHPHRPLRSGHHLRRKMDDVSAYGRGLRRSGGNARAVAGKAMRDAPPAHPRLHDVAKNDATKEDAAKQFGSLAVYGSDAYEIRKLIETDARLANRCMRRCPT